MDKTVRIFKSFEEAGEADAIARNELSPQERVDIFFAIRERANKDASEQGLAISIHDSIGKRAELDRVDDIHIRRRF